MTASTVKSLAITAIETSPRDFTSKINGGILFPIQDFMTVETTSIDEIGDIILLGKIPSNAIIRDLTLYSTDMDTNGTPTLAADIGLYYSGIGGTQGRLGLTSGVVVDADCFATAVLLTAANTTGTDVRFEATGATLDEVFKEAWDLAGLTSDPGGFFYFGLTMTAAAATAAAGKVALVGSFVVS